MTNKTNTATLPSVMVLMLLVNALIWARSSFEKVLEGTFVEGMPKSLGYFASKNPYPFVKDFLQNTAMPQASLFGMLTMWGEVLVALSLVGSLGYLLVNKTANKTVLMVLMAGLIGGMFFNIVFWFAAGWASPSTDSVNLLMLGLQAIGLFYTWKEYAK